MCDQCDRKRRYLSCFILGSCIVAVIMIFLLGVAFMPESVEISLQQQDSSVAEESLVGKGKTGWVVFTYHVDVHCELVALGRCTSESIYTVLGVGLLSVWILSNLYVDAPGSSI
ncbi:hypothetical protein RIF29_06165 [Crotalaria pallida]|uniref:Uncharacterized protein n=1 Tax=Crotalaria pallida TaxID=3830 RepID=A0AAN9J3N7_CROPI